jgi:hypothetical protein
MPVLVKGLENKNIEIKIKTADIIATLMGNIKPSLRLVGRLIIFEKLYNFIKWELRKNGVHDERDYINIEDKPEDRLAQYALNAVASLSICSKKVRTVLFEKDYYKTVLALVSNDKPTIRAAACRCIASLARAEKYPKQLLITEGIVDKLVKLLKDDNVEVVEMAIAALSNISLDIKKELSKKNYYVDAVIELIQSNCQALKYRAIFALKNLLFMATLEVKQLVLSKFSLTDFVDLFDDESTAVKEQAMCTMINLVNESQDWFNEELNKYGLEKVIQKLEENVTCDIPSVVSKALYLLCAITNSSEKHKELVIGSSILKHCLDLLGSKYVTLIQGVMDLLIITLEVKNNELRTKLKERLKNTETRNKLNMLQGESNKTIGNKLKVILHNMN